MKVKRSHLNIALVVLLAAVLWSVWGFLRPSGTPAGPRPAPEQPLLQSEVPRPGAGPQAIDPASIPAPPAVDMTARVSLGRDPFLFGSESREQAIAASAPAEVGPNPRVASILITSTRRLAVVEGRIVAVGDAVGTMKVAAIERDAVVFTTTTGERRRAALHAAPVPAGITR